MATNSNITLSKIHHRAMDVNILSKALISTTNTSVSVGSSSTSILVANTSRKTATFVNDSDEVIYLTLGEYDAIMNKGIRLNANGGSYEINVTNLYNGAITAICTSGSKNLCVTEGWDKIVEKVVINSNGWICYETSKTINSNSNLRELAQTVTVDSDAYIKSTFTKTITSASSFTVLGRTKTITSDAYITKLAATKTITSDMFIGYLGKSPASILQWAVIVE